MTMSMAVAQTGRGSDEKDPGRNSPRLLSQRSFETTVTTKDRRVPLISTTASGAYLLSKLLTIF